MAIAIVMLIIAPILVSGCGTRRFALVRHHVWTDAVLYEMKRDRA